MKKQILSEEFRRMQKLAGLLNEISNSDEDYDDFVDTLLDSELRQLIKEEIEKFISIQNFSPKDIYDFGGADGPINNNVTVVDIEDKDSSDKDFKGEWIVADLENFIKLPPKKVIHFSDSLNYFYSKNLAKTVHNALLPEGYIFHRGYYEDISSLFKDLSKLGNYKAINWNPNLDPDEDDIDETHEYQIIKKL